MQSMNIHEGLNIYVLTTCTFIFRQVCTIEHSFFKTTSGMHRHPFEFRHLAILVISYFNSLNDENRDLWIEFASCEIDTFTANYFCYAHYASPSSGEAYRDRQLTTNFELWVEIFCVPTCFHMRIPKPCLSVRTPRKEIIIASSISVLH